MTKTILILGGSYGGLHVAHYILKQKIPDVKVVLVSKSSHFYWNLASVRAIVPGQYTDEQLFHPLSDILSRYPSSSYELIIGSATTLDTTAHTLALTPADGTASRTIKYDQVVIATGSRYTTTNVPWKHLDTHDETVRMLHDTRDKVVAAKHIIVAGAGTTGIETAGELGFEYGANVTKGGDNKAPKEIWLLSASDKLASGDSIGPGAAAELTKQGVQIKYNARVVDSQSLPNGKTEVVLESGEKLTTDLYLPTQGMLANSDMVEDKYLNDKKNVKVDEMYRVQGAPAGTWALGDVVSSPRAGFLHTQKQAAGVGKNVVALLKDKNPTKVTMLPFDILVAAVGRQKGSGRLGYVPALNLMMYYTKIKSLGAERLPSYVDGSVA